VTMTKKPLDLATWLEYHHSRLRIRRFYIKVEDTPELAALFAQPPWDELVAPFFDNHTQRDYFAQMDRQSAHISAVLPLARADGLTHLLHIDDDELLYCSMGVDALLAQLAAAPHSRPDCHLCNIEALLPGDACASPFREAAVFRHFPTQYVSYTNGKSIGRLEEPTLRAHGPHHFRTAAAAGGNNSPVTFPIGPRSPACCTTSRPRTPSGIKSTSSWRRATAATPMSTRAYLLPSTARPWLPPWPSCARA